jgi:hypothetical protein
MKNFLILFSLLLISFPCFANVHLGPGQAYPNVQNAYDAGVIHAGDTVFLHAGSYTGYQGISKLKGNDLNWIVITKYKNDSIDISGNWQFMSCEYIKFLNLNFRSNTKSPGRLINVDNSGSCTTQSQFIRFDSCTFSNTTDANAITAFKFGGVDNFEVRNCYFHDIPACDAMDFNVCRNGLISDNLLENCLTGGHIKGGGQNIIMERNLFINSSAQPWVAFELGGDTGPQFFCPGDTFEVKNIKFYSNIIAGGYRGLALSSAMDCKVINNTFYNCGQATLRFLTTSITYPTESGNIVENNILAFGSSAYINGSAQKADAASFAKNIYYSISNSTFNGPYWDTPELDPIKDPNPINYGSGTPMFVSGTNRDFNLVAGSPAIGAGKPETEPATDFYGNPFSSTARSIGAIEYIVPAVVDEESSVNYTLFPNPASGFIKLPDALLFNNSQVSIFSSIGVIVYHGNATKRIDISTLSPGIYFLKVKDRIYKFVKM